MAQAKKPVKSPVKKSPVKRAPKLPESGSAIEAELLKALGADGQGDEEERAEFLQRMADGVNNDLDETAWEALSAETQDWFAKAAKLSDKGKPINEFPDAVLEEEAEEAEEADEEEETPAPKRGAKASAKPGTKPVAKAAPTKAKNGGGTPRGEGVKARLFQYFTGGNKGTLEQLCAKMDAGESSTRTALSDLRSDKYCYNEKPLNLVRDDSGSYSLSKGKRAA